VHHVEAKFGTHILRAVREAATCCDGARRRALSTYTLQRYGRAVTMPLPGQDIRCCPLALTFCSATAERSLVPELGRDISHDLGFPHHTSMSLFPVWNVECIWNVGNICIAYDPDPAGCRGCNGANGRFPGIIIGPTSGLFSAMSDACAV